jgi:hypothetical protein
MSTNRFGVVVEITGISERTGVWVGDSVSAEGQNGIGFCGVGMRAIRGHEA